MRKKLILIVFIVVGTIVLTGYVDSAASPGEEGVYLPVIMYHSILKEGGSFGDYVLPADVFEKDLEYLKSEGYETVTIDQLVRYVNYDGDLPNKPVMITFDDGNLNNMLYALPLLEKYDMTAVISVVGEYTERSSLRYDPHPNYANLSWDDISKIIDSGRIEIGNHTYAMHSLKTRHGASKLAKESMTAYRSIFIDDVQRLQNMLIQKCNYKPVVFAYPFGKVSLVSVEMTKEMGFLASFSCREEVNYLTRDPDRLYLLGRFNRPSGISTRQFMERLEKR